MGVILAITQGLNLLATIGPLAIPVALEIKKLFQGSGSAQPYDVQILAFENGIVKNQDETDKIIADWRAAHPEA